MYNRTDFWNILKRTALILTILVSILAIYQFIVPKNTQNSPAGSPSGSTQASTNSRAGTTPTLVQEQPTPTPTPIRPGDVLYEENGSDNWQGWVLSDPWKTLSDGRLVFPADTGKSGYAIAPVDLTGVRNFDIVASMRFPVGYNTWGGMFDAWSEIVACYSGQTDYRGGIHYDNFTYSVYAYVELPGGKQYISFRPGSNWHDYRLAVRGYTASLFIDDSSVAIAQANDSQYTSCGNQAGFGSDKLNVEVRSFKVIAR